MSERVPKGHSPIHVLATTTSIGRDHVVSGLAAGEVLQAFSATNVRFSGLDISNVQNASLDNLIDVSIGTLTSGEHLSYNGTNWVNAFTNPSGFQVPSGNYATVEQGHELWEVSGSAAALTHDGFADFVANEHIDHTSIDIIAGAGLTGGGDISTTRTLDIGAGTGIIVNADDIEVDFSVVGVSGFINPSGFMVPSGNYATFEAGDIDWATSGHSLEAHGDYNKLAPLASGQVISFNGTEWVNATQAAGGGGASQLDDLSDVSITSATSGNFLKHNGTEWINESHIELSGARLVFGGNADHIHLDTTATLEDLDNFNLAGIHFKTSIDYFSDSEERALFRISNQDTHVVTFTSAGGLFMGNTLFPDQDVLFSIAGNLTQNVGINFQPTLVGDGTTLGTVYDIDSEFGPTGSAAQFQAQAGTGHSISGLFGALFQIGTDNGVPLGGYCAVMVAAGPTIGAGTVEQVGGILIQGMSDTLTMTAATFNDWYGIKIKDSHYNGGSMAGGIVKNRGIFLEEHGVTGSSGDSNRQMDAEIFIEGGGGIYFRKEWDAITETESNVVIGIASDTVDDLDIRAPGDVQIHISGSTEFTVDATRQTQGGGLVTPVRTVTSADSMTGADQVILASGGTAFTVTLPAVATLGQTYTIKNTGTTSITVSGASSDGATIDGVATNILTQDDAIKLVSDTTNWYII